MYTWLFYSFGLVVAWIYTDQASASAIQNRLMPILVVVFAALLLGKFVSLLSRSRSRDGDSGGGDGGGGTYGVGGGACGSDRHNDSGFFDSFGGGDGGGGGDSGGC